jgi:type II secretory pathway pseudopilin PulG
MASRKSLQSLALEVFSIVLGVLLALGVSEWQENRQKAEQAEFALANVWSELEANQAILETVHSNNSETVQLSKATSASAGEDSVDRQFIPGVQVRAVAWNALLTTGISSSVDYSLLIALSEVYSTQSVYRETSMKLVEASMSIAAMATVQGTRVENAHFEAQFMPYLEMLLLMEETLLTGYEETLEMRSPSGP